MGTKSYSISLKQRHDVLCSDMDFQTDLHEKQRRVWKSKIGGNGYEQNALESILKEYESTIERQREQIKYKNEQIAQQKSVYEYEKNQQFAELSKEINHLKNQRLAEMEELKMKLEAIKTDFEKSKQENQRLRKLLQVTNNELSANKKLIEASRPMNASKSEQQLFQLEQDYLNLSEVLGASQHRVTKIENAFDSKQHDLINALQTEWEHTKEEVIRYKSKCRQLQQEKDEIIAQNMTIQQQMDHHHQHSHNNEENAEMIVLVHDLQRRLQKEDEVASQEMLKTIDGTAKSISKKK